MKKRIIIAALALATMCTPALAGVTMSIPDFKPGTPSVGTNMADTIDNVSGLGNAAGGIAAGANGAWNPSGNSFIAPPPGAIGAVGPRRWGD